MSPESGEPRATGDRRIGATRDDLDRALDALRREILAQIEGHDRLYREMFESGKGAVEAALNAQKEAVTKAEAASEKRFEGVNEFRAQLGDQQRTLMPRQECEVRLHAIEAQIETLSNAHIDRSGQRTGAKENMGYIVGIVGVLLAILTLALRFVGRGP